MTARIFAKLFAAAALIVGVCAAWGWAAGLVAGAVLAAIAAWRVAADLERVVNHAGELANGNFHARLAPMSGGEFGVLSGKLNETSSKLERTRAAAAERSTPSWRNWSASAKIS